MAFIQEGYVIIEQLKGGNTIMFYRLHLTYAFVDML